MQEGALIVLLSLVLMLTALLSLNCSFVLKSSLSFCTFWKKVPKTGAVVYGIRCFLCSQIANSIRCCNILQSVRTSPVAACRNAWGGKNSLRSNIMPPVSAHCLAARCASQRCPFAFGDELPFAMGAQWYCQIKTGTVSNTV